MPGSLVELVNICEDTKLTILIEKVGKAVAYLDLNQEMLNPLN